MILPGLHAKCVLQTVQMSKRALLAGLASMAIIPLQATQALALGDSKTVSMPTVRDAGFFLCGVLCTRLQHLKTSAGVCGWSHR